MVKDLKLESHQVGSYKVNLEIFKSNFSALNTSGTGTGKTFLTMAVALHCRYTLLVICPAGAKAMWEEVTTEYGIPCIVISYSILAGRGDKTNHPYLVKRDGIYYPTPALTELLGKKVLVVYDESQDAKNPKANVTKACHTITKEVIRVNNGSRIILLSATPVDKEDFVESVLKLTGIITADELFHYDLGHREYQMAGYGYQQLYNYCYIKNPKVSTSLYPGTLKAKNIRKSMFDLYVKIVKSQIVFSMPKPIINAKFIAKSRFYRMNQEDLNKMNHGLDELKDAVRYREDGTINYKSDGFGKIVQSMMIMEISKINLFCRLIEDTLNYIPHSKVIMYVWYDNTVDELMDRLDRYGPLRCDGKVDKKIREQYRKSFQEDNDNYRLIIAKPTSFGRSIGLHDTAGSRPRFTYINPNFKFNPIVQAAGRTYRVGTKSDVTINLTYSINTDESNVIYALSKKSEITRMCIASPGTNVVERDELDEDETEYEDIIPDEVPFVDKWESVYDN